MTPTRLAPAAATVEFAAAGFTAADDVAAAVRDTVRRHASNETLYQPKMTANVATGRFTFTVGLVLVDASDADALRADLDALTVVDTATVTLTRVKVAS